MDELQPCEADSPIMQQEHLLAGSYHVLPIRASLFKAGDTIKGVPARAGLHTQSPILYSWWRVLQSLQ